MTTESIAEVVGILYNRNRILTLIIDISYNISCFRYAYRMIFLVYSYVLITIPIISVLSYNSSLDGIPTTVAMCFSTAIGPAWFSKYQPNLQMWCGVLSIVIFLFTWFFHKQHMSSLHEQGVQPLGMVKKQTKFTRTVGNVNLLLIQ